MCQQQEEAQRDAHGRSGQAGHLAAVAQRLLLIRIGTGQQDREYVQHDDAARIDGELYRTEERIVHLKIEACRGEKHEKQVGRRPQDPARSDGQHRADQNHRGKDKEDYLL